MGEENRTVMVKFATKKGQKKHGQQLEKWVGTSLRKATPLFPDDEDLELSQIFELQLKPSAKATEVIEELSKREELEYAHEPEQRGSK